MPIKIEKTFQVKEPVERVWKFLSDPRKVAACVPGAQITEAVDSHTYKGSIKVQVGPSVTDYKGEVRIERLDDQAHEIFLLWYYRTVLYRSYVKGWKISPSHYLNQDLASVWLDQ